MPPRACVIVNPASGAGTTGRMWPEIESALRGVLEVWEPRFTAAPGDATRLARQAVLDGFDMLVSIGGDGSMNEVVCGLFREGDAPPEERLLRPGVTLAAVRRGTGGDFARMLGQPGALPGSVAHLAGETTRPCDLGHLEFDDHEGKRAQRGFLNIGSFGLSGLVVDKVNRSSKALGGRMSFFLGLAKALLVYRPQAVRIEIDAALFHEGPHITCAVANGQYFGGGMRIAPAAEIDDGRFDVVVQSRRGWREIVSVSDVYSGKHLEWASMRSARGSRIEARPLDPADHVLLDVDGEQPGRLPASFRILPKAVRLKV